MQRVIFVLLPDVEILDLAGPVQVFHEANRCGGDYRVLACATWPKLRTDQGIWLSDLEPLPQPEAAHGRAPARPLVAAAAAREMVVYLRRDGSHHQQSIYLDYRTHLHPGVHRVQDWLISHPGEHATLEDLARLAAMSPRNLTRAFRQATGITVQEFRTRLRLELARDLLHAPGLTLEAVASRCGFESARQLRRLWKETFGTVP